ncbi:tetratricopeptide repeat protein [Candidatus Parabeggiatoa sp. HSG14]|uniref:tetratricopeptide repeat protein n=1 Tax=Candidatus Parabeggiatoa sp. HSG14 TaxID=3055593 RepID=UPI0025A69A2C|nr:tetratricopeptide repeat protein [Thiotrichales bacterium HSG14]
MNTFSHTPTNNWYVIAFVQALIIFMMPVVWAATDEKWPQQVSEQDAVPFIHNKFCAECHPQQFKEWFGSHHEQAMQSANEKTVLGNFNNTSFTDDNVTSKFFKKGTKFFINTEDADGKLSDFEVKYTFGITPLQQYLLAFPKGRLQAFTVAWDTMNQRWFNLYPNEKIKPTDPLHWTKHFHNWNSVCAECHSTNLKLNYDLKTDSYKTTWAEINVSCQACHGPGGNHIKWANLFKNKKNISNNAEELGKILNKGLIVDYNTLNSKGQIETCARCHSRRYPISQNDQHGQAFLDDFVPELLRKHLYHPDGQIIDEVYVYGSFIQSKMYLKGVSCIDCHHPHTVKLRRQGNNLCIFCHQLNPPNKSTTSIKPKIEKIFKTLPSKNYNTPTHHFHKVDSPGAQCINCHMPTQTYMVNDTRHDHSFLIPRPHLSVKLGIPNACNQCHNNKSIAWAAKTVSQWYDKQLTPHFAETIAAGRTGSAKAKTQLIELAKDTSKPAIIRATVLNLLQQYRSEETTQTMITALTDKEALIRTIAVQGLENLPPQSKLNTLIPLLNDSIRAVRIEAAIVLATVPSAQLNQSQRLIFETVLKEYQQAQKAQPDQPQGHFNLGRLYTILGQLNLAEQSYKTAIKIDQYFFSAYNNLANLYYQMKRKNEAEKTLRQAIQFTTDQGILYYSLGLLLAEQQRPEEAVTHLAKATTLMPNHQRVHYNYGLLLQRLGKISLAETAFLKANQLNTNDQSILSALATLHIQQHQWEKAYTFAKRLNQLYPYNQEIYQMLKYIQKQRISHKSED